LRNELLLINYNKPIKQLKVDVLWSMFRLTAKFKVVFFYKIRF